MSTSNHEEDTCVMIASFLNPVRVKYESRVLEGEVFSADMGVNRRVDDYIGARGAVVSAGDS